MGLPLHVMSTSSSLNTVTPVLVKTDMVPLSEVLPTLISNVGKFWKVSACLAHADSLWNGSQVCIEPGLFLYWPPQLYMLMVVGWEDLP